MAKKKRSSMVGNGGKSQQEIVRHWGDLPVVDAKADLRVFIQPEDFAHAKAKDAGCCLFAQACKRQFAASKVMFWRSCAYVELPGSNGARRVERFELSADMRRLIEDFDKGNPVTLSGGFLLKRITPSMTFEAQREYQSLKRLRRKQTAAIVGTASSREPSNQGKGAYSRPPIVIDIEVRNGSGMVHFKKTADAS
jgi:hypothetical protein